MPAAVLQTSCNYLLHKNIWLQLYFSFLLVFERGSSLNLPYSPGCPWTHSVAQAWTYSNPSSASLVLGLLGYTCINHFPVGFGQGMSLQLLYPRVELPLCELFIKVFCCSIIFITTIPNIVAWKRHIPHRLMYLNIWSSVGGSPWEVYGTFRM